MSELLTAAQMRAIEEAAISSGEVTGLELMERAGAGVVEAIFEEWPELRAKGRRWFSPWRTRRKAVVFCGSEKNGGIGFVVARLLRKRGWEVVLFHLFSEGRPQPDTWEKCKSWMNVGKIYPFSDQKWRDPLLHAPHPDLWIDAIFGSEESSELPDLVTRMFHRVYYEQNWCTAPVVAVDIPTGISADTGDAVESFHLLSDLTVAFHCKLPGHVTGDGPETCRKIVVKDIGL